MILNSTIVKLNSVGLSFTVVLPRKHEGEESSTLMLLMEQITSHLQSNQIEPPPVMDGGNSIEAFPFVILKPQIRTAKWIFTPTPPGLLEPDIDDIMMTARPERKRNVYTNPFGDGDLLVLGMHRF